MKSSELVKTKVSKYGHAKGTSCLNEYLDKKETEASPVSDRDAVLLHCTASLSMCMRGKFKCLK